MRLATDMGGTFTDLAVEDAAATVRIYKSPTTPSDPLKGVFGALNVAADEHGVSLRDFLAGADTFIHGTTRSLNAILTGRGLARTALLVTGGHPDILLFREGGRTAPFDFTREFPRPYIPRHLTFELPERVAMDGSVVRPLDEDAVRQTLRRLPGLGVESVAVCLLWSVVNPAHERRIGELIAEELPGTPFTLSHVINPVVREYRRASSTAIDASIKPLMGSYLRALKKELTENGFAGRLLINTSAGGVQDADAIADAPIHTINSGPAMAPVAGRHFAAADAGSDLAIVADTGGTSYDVSLVRHGRIPVTQEAAIGSGDTAWITGFPAVDVRSVGAGGGSIAWVDDGGMLHVGPQSAGSEPGPVCYGRGGTRPTVTDVCLVLGYIDPEYFLGGRMKLDTAAAERAIAEQIAAPLAMDVREAAAVVLQLATEHMVGAIDEITLKQGIPCDRAVLIGGGGAAGFNTVAIGRRLGCPQVVVPSMGAVLSAAGALMSDLSSEYAATLRTTTDHFDHDGVSELLSKLRARCAEFIEGPGAGALETSIELFAEARYPHQVWELEVPLRVTHLAGPEDVETLRQDFHRVHREVFAIDDAASAVEVVSWRARVRCRLRKEAPVPAPASPGADRSGRRSVYFAETGQVDATVHHFDQLAVAEAVTGPAIIESPVTTVVVDPGARATRTAGGSLLIEPTPAASQPATPSEEALVR